ncbi:hypothetical protein FDECE_3884, partial [Fusarium decemcellulare]
MSTTPTEEQHPQPKLTVAGSAQSCVESFQDCLNKASNADKITASHHPKPSLVQVEDQLARFSLWTANIRVFGPGRGSLDHRLREAHDVQNAVIGVLQAVNYRVKTCCRILESISSKPDDGIIQTLLKELDEVLEGASKDTQNLNAAKTFKIEDGQGNDTGLFLQQLFTNYIRDRFPGTTDNLRQRLADSMVLRRKRILYRRARYGKTSIRAPEVVPKPVISHPRPEPTAGMAREPVKRRVVEPTARSAVPSTTQTATTLSPEKFQRASNPSVISVSKTVALSSHDELSFPPAPCGGLMRRYNRLKREKEEQHRAVLESIPGYEGQGEPPPHYAQLVLNAEAKQKEALAKDWQECLEATVEVTCPYCFYALPVQDVVDERKWKLHVKNDLDPDVWLKHMKEHALRWRCIAKSHGEFAARTRDEYLNHMKTSHPGKFTDTQLGVLADRNARLPGPLFKSCPLCGVEEVDSSMEDHVVGHMRFLALKSLPAYQEDTDGLEEDESENEQDSLATSRPRSRSTIRNDPDKDTELFFDDPGGNELERTSKFNIPPIVAYIETDSTAARYHASWDENQIEQQDFLNLSDPPTPIAVLHDPSAEFDEHSEWGFVPDTHESFEDMTADPIVRNFLDWQHRPVSSRERVYRWDPDCAICHAPASVECDCEAKGLDAAIKQAEEMVMSSAYREVRTWVREKSQQFIRGHFRSHWTIPQQPEKSREKRGQGDSSAEASKIQEPSQQEVNEAWQESFQKYPVTLEYFFGLVEYTLPAEDEPA